MTQLADSSTLLRRLLESESVAIVGASADTTKVGARPVEYLLRTGYQGRIYPVNPRREHLLGLRCYPSLSQLPEVPDLVAVVVAADRTEAVVSEAAELGVPSLIVISSGFGEIDTAGADLEQRLAAIARQHGMVLVGPNSVGVIHTPNRMAVTFTEALSRGPLTRPGGIGIVSQSGAFGTVIFALARAADLGLRSYVSTGNEAAFGLADFLLGLVEDPEIRVVGGYVETIRDGQRFEAAARRAEELGKPIALVKVGSSEAGRSAASSHTGAVVGNDDVYEAAFRRHGILRVQDERHLLATLDAFDIWYRRPEGRRVAVVSMSGGAGVLLCDELDRLGLEVAEFPARLVSSLAELLPPFASLTNPVDLTGQFVANNAGLQEVLSEIAGTDGIDAVLFFAGVGWTGDGAWAQSVVQATESGAPIMVITQLASDVTMKTLRDAGVPVSDSPLQAARVLASVVEWMTRRRYPTPEPIRSAAMPNGRPSEAEGKSLLEAIGIPVPRRTESPTADGAGSMAETLGVARVVIKAQGRGIEHKTELGAIEIGVPVKEASDACLRIADRIREKSAESLVESFLIEEIVPDGLDCVVGAVWEEPFGHLVMVGLGGTTVELLGDVAFGLAPMGVAEAETLIRSLKGFPLLDGFRGAEPLDVAALASAVSKISRLCAGLGPALRELDVNPIRVLPAGRGVIALDVLMIGQDNSQAV